MECRCCFRVVVIQSRKLVGMMMGDIMFLWLLRVAFLFVSHPFFEFTMWCQTCRFFWGVRWIKKETALNVTKVEEGSRVTPK